MRSKERRSSGERLRSQHFFSTSCLGTRIGVFVCAYWEAARKSMPVRRVFLDGGRRCGKCLAMIESDGASSLHRM
jgi:hypothetical protein